VKQTAAFLEVPAPQTKWTAAAAAAVVSALRMRWTDVSVVNWVRGYNRHKAVADVVAALVVTTMLLPQALAYALLAGVPPAYGLYSSIVPVAVMGGLTTSSQISPGPNGPSAILMAGMVSKLTSAAPLTPEFVRVTNAFAFVVGVSLMLMAVVRLGTVVANLLSWPVMSGFTTGAALTIIASQVVPLLGVTIPSENNAVMKVARALEFIMTARWRVIIVSAVFFVVFYWAKRIAIRGRKLPGWVPVPLIGVGIAVLVSWAADFKALGIPTVGTVPSGLPTPTAPPLADVAEFVAMLPSAALMGVINYVQTVSVELFLAKKVGERVNPTTELLALGASGVVGSCFSSHAICGGFTRSAVQNQAGAKTPATILWTATFMLIATVAVSSIFSYLPTSVLAAMIVAAALQLVNVSELRAMWRNNKSDFMQSAVTTIFVLALGLEYGILAGVLLGLLLMLWRSFTPRLTELGRLPGTSVWVALYRYPQATPLPYAKVFRLDGELNFGNVFRVVEPLTALAAAAPPPAPLLPATASLLAAADAEEVLVAELEERVSGTRPASPLTSLDRPRAVFAIRTGAGAGGGDAPGAGALIPAAAPPAAAATDPTLPVTTVASTRDDAVAAIILDCVRIVSADGTACLALRDLVQTCKAKGVLLLFVGLPGPTRDMMARYGVNLHKGSRQPAVLSLLTVDCAISYVEEARAVARTAAAGGSSAAGTDAVPVPMPLVLGAPAAAAAAAAAAVSSGGAVAPTAPDAADFAFPLAVDSDAAEAGLPITAAPAGKLQ